MVARTNARTRAHTHMQIHMRIYAHTCAYTPLHVSTRTRTSDCAHEYGRAYRYTCTRSYAQNIFSSLDTCARAHTRASPSVCVCVCVCVRERERECVCVCTPTYMHSYINHAHADAAYTEMKSALESAPGQGMNKEIYAFRYVDPLEEGKTR